MHAVRGTIGFDPAATARAEGRGDLYPTTATKQASRDRWFGSTQPLTSEELEGLVKDGKTTPKQTSYDLALTHLDAAVAELSPLTTSDVPAYGISD